MYHDEISTTEAGLRLGLDVHAVMRLLMRGELGRPRKVGNRWMIPATGVTAYIQRREPAAQNTQPV